MREPTNIANAAVIIACLYFLIDRTFGFWAKAGIFLILLFALATWGYWHFTDDHKKLLKMQIGETEARTRNFNAHTAFMATQSAHAVRGLKN